MYKPQVRLYINKVFFIMKILLSLHKQKMNQELLIFPCILLCAFYDSHFVRGFYCVLLDNNMTVYQPVLRI